MIVSCFTVTTWPKTILGQDSTMGRIVMATWTIDLIQLDGQNVVRMILKTILIANQIFVSNELIAQQITHLNKVIFIE